MAQSRIIDMQTRKSHPKECLELEELAIISQDLGVDLVIYTIIPEN